MIHVAIRGGPCFNPAVGLAGTIYSVSQLENKGSEHYAYLWAYLAGPFVGGLVAGFANIEHTRAIETLTGESVNGGLLDKE